MKVKDQKCIDCYFMRANECRFDPPKVVIYVGAHSSNAKSAYPFVSDDDWCGKWKEEEK